MLGDIYTSHEPERASMILKKVIIHLQFVAWKHSYDHGLHPRAAFYVGQSYGPDFPNADIVKSTLPPGDDVTLDAYLKDWAGWDNDGRWDSAYYSTEDDEAFLTRSEYSEACLPSTLRGWRGRSEMPSVQNADTSRR